MMQNTKDPIRYDDELNPNLPAEQEEINKNRIVRVSDKPVYHVVIDNMFGEKASKEMFSHVISLKDKFKEAALHKAQTGEAVIVRSFRNNQTCFIDDIFPRWNLNPVSWENEMDTWQSRKQYRAEQSPLLKNIDNLFQGYDYMLTELMACAPFPFCKLIRFDIWETQISRYGSLASDEHKSHYTWHHDRLLGDGPIGMGADDRMVSMVYYLHGEHRRFAGGQLRLSNGLIFKGQIIQQQEYSEDMVIAPKNDRLVIFDSRTAHCVDDTIMATPENNFEDGRFSANIWCGRRDLTADIF